MLAETARLFRASSWTGKEVVVALGLRVKVSVLGDDGLYGRG